MLKVPERDPIPEPLATVLVVDDAAATRHLVTQTLKQLGFSTLSAADGYAALEVARNFRPDAIVTDLEMPRMDGEALIEGLRNGEIEQLQDIPIIVCSSKINPQTLGELSQLHVEAVVPKPVNVRTLAVAALRYFNAV
ncbi:MAG: response regulator [Rhodopirellula sp. JB044]|uniref:response regulator n=1 Tax=Rhodopirellula sp. JB044 TaxID=3342844 RepID=UPI00370BF2BF